MATVELSDRERIHVNSLIANLSSDEREVVRHIAAGQMNKAMARMLGVGGRTIEARRSRAMEKLQVRTVPDLVKIWIAYSCEFQLSGVSGEDTQTIQPDE